MRRKALSYLHFFAPCPAKLVCFAPAGQPKEYHGQVTAPRPAKRKIFKQKPVRFEALPGSAGK